MRKGFTLIELLVVVAIIAILSAVGLSTFTNAQRNARDARRRADIKGIQGAAEQYYLNCGVYPASLADFRAVATGCAAGSGVVQYLQTIADTSAFPTDPRGGVADFYEVVANSTSYEVCADTEVDLGVVDSTWAAATDENDVCVRQLQ